MRLFSPIETGLPGPPPRPLRAPLLWVLLPGMAGQTLAFQIGAPPLVALFGAGALAIGAAAIARQKAPWAVTLWAIFLLTAATFASWQYAAWRAPPFPDEWQNLPSREVFATLEVKRLYRAADRFGYASGVANVVEADFPADDLRGALTAFYLKPSDGVPAPGRGGLYRVRGVIRFLEPSADLRDFDRHLVDTGIYFSLRQGRLLEELAPAPVHWRTADQLRANLVAALLRQRPESGAGEILAAMFLGQRSLLTPEQKAGFVASGTLHLFAISGLHVATVAGLLHLLLGALRLPRWMRAAVGLAILLSYVLITGASPSAWRAFAMVSFFWTAALFPRPSNPFAALVGSALVVLLLAPGQLQTAGFQLSYAVVAMLILYGRPLADGVESLLRKRGTGSSGSASSWQRAWLLAAAVGSGRTLAFSAAAWLGSAPLVAHYFGIVTPFSILLNVLLVTLGSVAVTAAAFASFAALLWLPLVATYFAHAGWVVVTVMLAMVQSYRWIPGGTIAVEWRAGWLPFAASGAMLAVAFWFAQPHQRATPGWCRWGLPLVLCGAFMALGLRSLPPL